MRTGYRHSDISGRSLLSLAITPVARLVARHWHLAVARHNDRCAQVEAIKRKQAMEDEATFQARAALARSKAREL